MSAKFSPKSADAQGADPHDGGTEHECDLAERIGKLMLDPEFSDLELIVQGEALPVHRAILVSSGEYLRSLLRDGTRATSHKRVVLENVPLRGFKQVLGYIYTGKANSVELNVDSMVEVLEIANLLGLEKLLVCLSRTMQERLSVEDFCQIYAKTQIDHLDEAFIHSMDKHPQAALESEAFCHLPAGALGKMLSRDTFSADEMEIFKAVKRWCEQQPSDKDIPEVLKTVRLPLIATRDLATEVMDSGLIAPDLLLRVIGAKENHTVELNHRGQILFDENLAEHRGTKQVIPKAGGNIVVPSTGSRFESKPLPPVPFIRAGSSLIIALDKPYSINYIGLEFSGQSTYSSDDFKGHVEVSTNLVNWITIGDYRRCYAFRFEPRHIRYIRVTQIMSDAHLTTLIVCLLRSHLDPIPLFRFEEETDEELLLRSTENLTQGYIRQY